MNKTLKIVFNKSVTQEQVDAVAELVVRACAMIDVTAVCFVGEEDCQEADNGEDQ